MHGRLPVIMILGTLLLGGCYGRGSCLASLHSSYITASQPTPPPDKASKLAGGWVYKSDVWRIGRVKHPYPDGPQVVYVRTDGSIDLSRTHARMAGDVQSLRVEGDRISNLAYIGEVVWTEYTPTRSRLLIKDTQSRSGGAMLRRSDLKRGLGLMEICLNGDGSATYRSTGINLDKLFALLLHGEKPRTPLNVDKLIRIPDGYCQHCACDLSASVSDRCPGCGAPIPKDSRHAEPNEEEH